MLDLFFPLRCIHCDERCSAGHAPAGYEAFEKHLCSSCVRMLSKTERPDPEKLNEHLQLGGNFDQDQHVVAAFSFEVDGIVQSVIHHFKYYGMPKLARQCGRLLARIHKEELSQIDYILPVPLHRTRVSSRGSNQSDFLAKGISDILGTPVLGPAYAKLLRPTKSQTKLTLEERRANVNGAFALREKTRDLVKGKRVLVLDDVLTTGATLSSFGDAVRAAEPRELRYLTFSAAEWN